MGKLKLSALLLGAALFLGFGATSLSAQMKCGAGKCGSSMKAPKACGKKDCTCAKDKCTCGDNCKCGEKKGAMKCGAGKCGNAEPAKKAMKCGAGKCGSK